MVRLQRAPIVTVFLEILIVHSCFLLAWKFLWPYLSQYVPELEPLLDVIWNRVLEPYAVVLLSVPSVTALFIILCYIAAKCHAKDVFNVEGIVIVLVLGL